MATSEIKLYKTKLTPAMNAKVDNIEDYLNSVEVIDKPNCQYQKHALDITLKLTLEQTYAFGVGGYNYVKIVNSDDNRTIYYFVINSAWTSKNCVTLFLSMDTVNSFDKDIVWSDNTHITRRHKDRFVYEFMPSTGSITLVRKVDKESEGINPAKFYNIDRKKIYDEDLSTLNINEAKKSNWYLIYRANQDLTTSSQNANNPVELFVTSNYPFEVNGLSTLNRPSTGAYLVMQKHNDMNMQIFIDGTTPLPKFGEYAVNDIKGWIFYPDGKIKYVFLNSSGQYAIQSDTFANYTTIGSNTGFNYSVSLKSSNLTVADVFNYDNRNLTNFTGNRLQTIDTINRTESKYMKIIELPYPPFEFTFDNQGKINIPQGWSISNGMFYTNNIEKDFYRLVGVQPLDEMKYTFYVENIRSTDKPNIELESKLYNSEFYDFNIRYDSFEKQYLLERFNATTTEQCEYQVMFKPSNTINSNFLFEFYDLYEVYDEIDIRSQYVNVRRNNELPMYNSDYLNYIRNGYNYDVKVNRNNVIASRTSSIAGITGAIIGGIKGGKGYGVATAISIGVNAVSNLASSVINQRNAELSIQQKLEELKNSPSSVNGADDIDLLNYTTGNKLEVYTNSCTDNMKNAVFNLFRLTGYACNEYNTPNMNTRYWYDFIQCEAEFDNEEDINVCQNVVEDIKTRYATGVTVYHNRNNEYDFDQMYENYETWIIGTL